MTHPNPRQIRVRPVIRRTFQSTTGKATGNQLQARSAGFAEPESSTWVIQEASWQLQDTAIVSEAAA